MAQVMGAKDVELPSIDKEIHEFNEWLVSEPEPVQAESVEQRILRRALGLKE